MVLFKVSFPKIPVVTSKLFRFRVGIVDREIDELG
jgi:hypothetical protein